MSLRTQTVGRLGEQLAEEHLMALGARLLERNYRFDFGEIDLLLEHDGDLVAVEVKTRDVADLEQPEEAIRWPQLRPHRPGERVNASNCPRPTTHWS